VTYLFKYRFIFCMSLLAAILYSHFYLNRANVEIRIQSPGHTYFKVYWASERETSYSDKKMARIRMRPGIEEYSFFINDLRDADSLRIDPAGMAGEILVKDIIIRQPGIPTIRFSKAEDFEKLRPFGDVQSTTFSEKGWAVTSTGGNPRFQFHIPVVERNINWIFETGRFLLLLLPALLLLQLLQPLWPNNTYTVYCGVFALGLILTMAVISMKNHHPDEIVHISAVQYYTDNWLPPAVESPEIRHTYSIYGFSRLNTLEPSYFLAGKFSSLLGIFHLDTVLTFRLFNVLLFSILTFLAVKNVQYRLLLIPLLLSPQIWYIFSYVNSDAFALFTAVLAAGQMVVKNSALNHFLEHKKIPIRKIIGLGLLFGLLLLVKKPFYFFILFFLFYFVWRCVFQPFTDFRGMVKRLLIIACIGSSLVAMRLAADVNVNGFTKQEQMRTMQELTAAPTYKPSTELHSKHIHLQMRERGTNLESFLKQHRWGEKTFRTGVGVYGYMTVASSNDYYNMMRMVGLAALLFMGISIAIRGGWSGNILFSGALLCSAALIGVACYHAWTIDFQAQGRYLFAITAILGMVLVKTEALYNQILLRTFVCSMFLLSAYSFIGTALFGLSKYGWG